jgi:SNF2 family DNA or RNA helicase
MAHGVNAQEGNAQHIIFHSLTPDFEVYDQLISRLARSGNKSSCVFVHRIIAADTVDELLIDLLRSKGEGQAAFHEAMRAYTMRRYGRELKTPSRSIAKRLKKS